MLLYPVFCVLYPVTSTSAIDRTSVNSVMDSPEAFAIDAYADSDRLETTAESPMHPAIGETIQGFEITGLAPDQGAESDLYLVRSPVGEKCALKLYRSGIQPATAIAALQVRHPRIVSPLITGVWNGRPYEIAPFFEDGSLAHLIQRNGPLKLSSAESILRQLVEGLAALHRAGIQHRDLKPSNILIKNQSSLEIVLADFGSSALATITLLTQVRTTLAYAAPETLTGMYSRASDYWSLGIIVVEMLTGQNPLQWFGPSRIAHYQIVQGKVPIPETLPARWQRLLKGLLERDHYKRWDEARILAWLAETDEPQNKAHQVRRLIFVGVAAAIVLIGTLLGVGLWQSTVASGDHAPPALTTGASPLPQFSFSTGHPTALLDLRSVRWVATGILVCTWILALGSFLAGFGHCISGTSHGLALICAGVVLALFAFYLLHLLSFSP
jgi:serine/threonine protein kinase